MSDTDSPTKFVARDAEGEQILDRFEQRLRERFEGSDFRKIDGPREYYGTGWQSSGFEAELTATDPDWRDHISRA